MAWGRALGAARSRTAVGAQHDTLLSNYGMICGPCGLLGCAADGAGLGPLGAVCGGRTRTLLLGSLPLEAGARRVCCVRGLVAWRKVGQTLGCSAPSVVCLAVMRCCAALSGWMALASVLASGGHKPRNQRQGRAVALMGPRGLRCKHCSVLFCSRLAPAARGQNHRPTDRASASYPLCPLSPTTPQCPASASDSS
jgi:hypothetical protein